MGQKEKANETERNRVRKMKNEVDRVIKRKENPFREILGERKNRVRERKKSQYDKKEREIDRQRHEDKREKESDKEMH